MRVHKVTARATQARRGAVLTGYLARFAPAGAFARVVRRWWDARVAVLRAHGTIEPCRRHRERMRRSSRASR
ncbi:hypothetical protein NUM3379_31600 [Kineococcus sp. NUM-3379]